MLTLQNNISVIYLYLYNIILYHTYILYYIILYCIYIITYHCYYFVMFIFLRLREDDRYISTPIHYYSTYLFKLLLTHTTLTAH